MPDRLSEYRRKRDANRTPEPVPSTVADSHGQTFVIQQHHASSLHWDLRLERDGVLVSWAVPRGLPKDPGRDHLAVHTEDHPMEYADFHGEIPAGEYGGGRMTIHDRGTYTAEKWRDDEVMFTLTGERSSGRYVLYRTGDRKGKGSNGKDWMIHRMDGPPEGWEPMERDPRPMLASLSEKLPGGGWAYELEWPGIRVTAQISGGRLRLLDARAREVTADHKELRAIGEWFAPTECVLDGVILDLDGPQLFVFDLLWLDGHPTTGLSYADRRELLTGLAVEGERWQTPPHFPPGAASIALETAAAQGLPGVVAKRLDAPYEAGARSRDWLRAPVTR